MSHNVLLTHMLVDPFTGMACDININDGNAHSVTSDYTKVTCEGCRVKWADYTVEQYKSANNVLESELATQRNRNALQRATIEKLHAQLNMWRRDSPNAPVHNIHPMCLKGREIDSLRCSLPLDHPNRSNHFYNIKLSSQELENINRQDVM